MLMKEKIYIILTGSLKVIGNILFCVFKYYFEIIFFL